MKFQLIEKAKRKKYEWNNGYYVVGTDYLIVQQHHEWRVLKEKRNGTLVELNDPSRGLTNRHFQGSTLRFVRERLAEYLAANPPA